MAGSFPGNPCEPAEPAPIIIFHGTADKFVPYDGGKSKRNALHELVSHPPVKDAVSFWVKHSGCGPQPEIEQDDVVKKETYSKGKNHTEVILYTIAGGGHTWPGTKVREADPQDPMQAIDATSLIRQFFSRHPK